MIYYLHIFMCHRTVTCSNQLQNSEEGIKNSVQVLFIVFLTWMEDVHFKLFLGIYQYCVWVCIHMYVGVCPHARANVWRSKETLWEYVLSSHHSCFRIRSDHILTTYPPSCWKHLSRTYPLSCGESSQGSMFLFLILLSNQ